jgi:peptide deformylase
MSKLKGKARARVRAKKVLKSKKRYTAYKKGFIDEIRKFDDPILKTECLAVTERNDNIDQDDAKYFFDSISDVAADMCRTLLFSEGGVGIAAPQIGYDVRIIAIRPTADSKPDIMINPEIVSHGPKALKAVEGCLSYPGYYSLVERYLEIKVKFIDKDNKHQEKDFEGFAARIIQHEIEHLNGNNGCAVGCLYERAKTDPEALAKNEEEVREYYHRGFDKAAHQCKEEDCKCSGEEKTCSCGENGCSCGENGCKKSKTDAKE